MRLHWHAPEPCEDAAYEVAADAHTVISLHRAIGQPPLSPPSVGKHRGEWPGVEGEHALGFTCGCHKGRVAS